MAQAGFTPIQLYFSTTASAVPTAGNLANGELAINITDGKLYYKSNAGTVTVLAGAGGTGIVAGSNTQVQYNNNGVFGASANLTFNGTTLTAGGLTTTGTTSTGVLSVTGNTTLGDASADNVTVNGTVTSNLIFTDNTYDIGASGATRPRTGYFGTSMFIGNNVAASTQFEVYGTTSTYTSHQVLFYDISSSNGSPSNGLTLKREGGNSGFYSSALTFDIGGGGGNARMYTSRLGSAGGILYFDTMATNGTYYNRFKISEVGEWTWLNNNVTTGATAMTLSGQNLAVNGQIQSNLEDGLVSTSQNAANNGIYLQVRPYAGQSGYLTFTENAIADRWAIGIQPSDSTLYFRAGQVTATAVAQLTSAGKLALASGTLYSNANLSVPWVNVSSPASVIYGINALTADVNRGAFGDFSFRSSTSFANMGAQANMYLAARNYGTAPSTANDVTEKVGLWIRGYYDNNGAAVPLYLGGYAYNTTAPAMIIDQSSNVGIGTDPSYQLDMGNGTTVNQRIRLQRGSDDSSQFITLGWNSISVHRTSSPITDPQSTLALNQVGSNGTRTALYVDTTGFVGVGTTTPVSGLEVSSAASGARRGITVTNSDANAGPAYIAFKGYDWVRSAIWNDRAGANPLQFAVNPNTSDLTVNGCAVVGGFTTGGVFYAKSGATLGNLQGRIVTGSSGTASIGALSGGGGVIDTGITVNQISQGGTMLFLCSVNTSAGTSTTSAVYMIQLYYDGNNTPTATLISGSNSWSFGQSGSNTLTVTGPAGNNAYAWFGNK